MMANQWSIFIFLVSIDSFGIFTHIQAQILEDEVPPELKYVFNSDLDKWEPPEELSQKYPYYLSGFDLENRPIWVVEFGKWDLQYTVDNGEKGEKLFDKYMDKWIWNLWNSGNARSTKEQPVKDGFLIIDLDGINHRFFQSPKALALFLRKLQLVVSVLPFAQGCYIVNANLVAKNLINMVRPIVGKDFHKIEVFGTNPNSYKPHLLKNIPKDQLPEWYGGSKDFKPVEVFGR